MFVSTEYVFDGKRGYYREDEEPSPNTHYGQTKWEAERAVMHLASRWSILRTSIVYGWPAPGKAELRSLADPASPERQLVSYPHRRLPDSHIPRRPG